MEIRAQRNQTGIQVDVYIVKFEVVYVTSFNVFRRLQNISSNLTLYRNSSAAWKHYEFWDNTEVIVRRSRSMNR